MILIHTTTEILGVSWRSHNYGWLISAVKLVLVYNAVTSCIQKVKGKKLQPSPEALTP